MAFMSSGAERAFEEAIAAIEKASSAEVIVTVRPRLPRTFVANLAALVTVTVAVLAFVLYIDDWEFDEWSLLVVPTLAGLAAGWLVEAIPAVENFLVRDVPARMLAAARAAFVELGVHRTRGRTGLLVYISVRERRLVLVGDLAVVEKVRELDRHAATLAAALPGGGEAVAAALGKLAGDFGTALPHAVDDINELPDAVDTRMSPPRMRARPS
jgi:putative membrane protein